VIQQRLSGSTTIKAGLRPKNLIGGGLFDLRPGRLVEDLQQAAGVLSGLEGDASQGRHAGDGLRRRHDLQEPTSDAQADPLGLGDGGELAMRLGGDLDGVVEALPEGLDLGPVLGELELKPVDPGFGRGAVDGLDDLAGLAVERLP
jgi:hypothetical protein